MKIVAEKQRKVNEEKLLREKELARVKVNKEDVELIVSWNSRSSISIYSCKFW